MTQNGTAPRAPKLPPSTPEGDAALRATRARCYAVKRAHEFKCAHPGCKATEQIVVINDGPDHFTTRCLKHVKPSDVRVPGQWIDSQREEDIEQR